MINTTCYGCKNHVGVGFCLAFPNGIPKEIAEGRNDHREPYKGDNGIQFEPIKE